MVDGCQAGNLRLQTLRGNNYQTLSSVALRRSVPEAGAGLVQTGNCKPIKSSFGKLYYQLSHFDKTVNPFLNMDIFFN
jgi:hypothetical protein